ncbi:MAG: hypothetical protein KJ065_00925 [Anaerolineae bacterium]|nr:hypothetical protein [Anaerolineae bacterium]
MSRLLPRLLWPVLAVLLAACGSVAEPIWEQAGTATSEAEIQAANATAIALGLPSPTPVTPTATATETSTPTTTPTPIPTATATFTSSPIPPTEPPTLAPTSTTAPTINAETAGAMPVGFEDKVASANPEAGMTLFNTPQNLPSGQVWMCSQCHSVTPDEARLIGPGLWNIGMRAETQVAGQDAITYIYTSITHPGDFIVQGDPPYPENLMPNDFSQVFSEDNLANLIAYLLTLK